MHTLKDSLLIASGSFQFLNINYIIEYVVFSVRMLLQKAFSSSTPTAYFLFFFQVVARCVHYSFLTRDRAARDSC